MSEHLRVLHAVRVLGYADTARVSDRALVSPVVAEEILLDAQAVGQVSWSRFADQGGWSLTETGKATGEALLANELDTTGARSVVESVMTDFDPLNRLVGAACTSWQLAEIGITTDTGSLSGILADLGRAARGWEVLEERLTALLPRFTGYHARFIAAVHRAASDPAWVTAIDRDSAHRVWFELHEDLLATLGRTR